MGSLSKLVQWFRRLFTKECDTSVTNEPQLWTLQLPRAQAAIRFWSSFLDLRMGDGNVPIDEAGQASLVRFVRALSWTESRHGTGSGVHPAEDPCQCANPGDAWWKELTGPPGSGDFLQKGNGPGGFFAGDLATQAEADSGFAPAAILANLVDATQGHNDPNFVADMSFYWAVPFFLHMLNHAAGRTTAQCGNFLDAEAIEGAVAYNGGGDPDCYRQKYTAALSSMVARFDRTLSARYTSTPTTPG